MDQGFAASRRAQSGHDCAACCHSARLILIHALKPALLHARLTFLRAQGFGWVAALVSSEWYEPWHCAAVFEVTFAESSAHLALFQRNGNQRQNRPNGGDKPEHSRPGQKTRPKN